MYKVIPLAVVRMGPTDSMVRWATSVTGPLGPELPQPASSAAASPATRANAPGALTPGGGSLLKTSRQQVLQAGRELSRCRVVVELEVGLVVGRVGEDVAGVHHLVVAVRRHVGHDRRRHTRRLLRLGDLARFPPQPP